ncbi:MAG: NAD(P)-dependent oxidoreductase [Sulfitobacter sp.]
MGTKVLVLGSSGRIGTMLRPVWDTETCGREIEFTYQTRRPDPEHVSDVVWSLEGPAPAQLREAGPFDVLLVLSGVVPRAGAKLEQNMAIGLNSLEAAKALGAKTVVLASSSAVYGMQSDSPYHEDDCPAPANDYGRAKYDMEQRCAVHARDLGLMLCCLRIGNVAGADALLGNGAALKPGERLRIDSFDGGATPLRSYIGPHTLAKVLCELAQNHKTLPDALNIGAPNPVEMAALAQAAGMAFDLVPAMGSAHQYITLDCAALAGLYSFSATDSDPAQMVAQWRSLRND